MTEAVTLHDLNNLVSEIRWVLREVWLQHVLTRSDLTDEQRAAVQARLEERK